MLCLCMICSSQLRGCKYEVKHCSVFAGYAHHNYVATSTKLNIAVFAGYAHHNYVATSTKLNIALSVQDTLITIT